jgi:hypothetical protein
MRSTGNNFQTRQRPPLLFSEWKSDPKNFFMGKIFSLHEGMIFDSDDADQFLTELFFYKLFLSGYFITY